MVLYRSPKGERLDIPAKGVRAIRALGWVPVGLEPAEPAAESQSDTPAGPPRGNASRDAWAKHADAMSVSYPEDATRDEIKAAVAAAQG